MEESLDFLPDAVELPPFDEPGEFMIAENVLPPGRKYDLLLIGGNFSDGAEWRLELAPKKTTSGLQTWGVHPVKVNADGDAPAEKLAPPVAEFTWDEGQLRFQWKFAADPIVRASLRNSLLNVSLDDKEHLLQLRSPIKGSAMRFDLSKKSLRAPVEIPHPPPLERLRLQITEIEFPGLRHTVDAEQPNIGMGERVQINVESPPGVQFDVWFTPIAEKLTLFAEGHYWLGSTTPIEFAQHRVEAQAKAFVRRSRSAAMAVPRLQRTISALEAQFSALEVRRNRLRSGRYTAHSVAVLGMQMNVVQNSLAAARLNLAQAQRTIPAAAQALASVQQVARLGSAIHNSTPIQYRVYLPIERDGIRLEVVLFETVPGDPPPQDQTVFTVDSPSDSDHRQPIPAEEEREAAREILAAEYKKAYEDAKDSEARHLLATTFIDQANGASDDPPRQFELYRLAWVVLVNAGDISGALEAVDQLEHLFEIDRTAVRTAVLRSAIKSPVFENKSAVLVSAILSVVDDAILDDQRPIAIELLQTAKAIEAKMGRLNRQLEFKDRIAFLEAEQQLAEDEASLLFNPDDTEAHLRVGRSALAQGRNWNECLTILSKGGDSPIAEASRLDLAEPTDPMLQLELADRWYELAKLEEQETKSHIEQRAALWYAESLPHLSGFSRTKAEARLESLNGPVDKRESQ